MKLSIFAAVACTATVLAQSPSRPAPRPAQQAGPQQLPRVDEAKAFLGLSDAQIQKLRSLEQQKGKDLQALFKEIGEKEKALHGQLQSGSANAAAVGALVLDIESLHKKVGQMDANYHDQAVKSLDAGQGERLKRLEDAAKMQQMLEDARRLGPAIGQAASLQLVPRPSNPPVEPGPGRMGPRRNMGPGGPDGPGMVPRNGSRNGLQNRSREGGPAMGSPMGPGGPPPKE